MNVPADDHNAEPRASKSPDRTLFWVAALALGRGVIRRYRRFLDPRDWFGKACR